MSRTLKPEFIFLPVSFLKLESGVIIINDALGDFFGDLFVIGVRGQVAAFNHIHPDMTLFDEPELERLVRGVFGAINFGVSPVFQEIAQRFPGQFVGVFKGLNQSLLFQVVTPPPP